VSPSGGLGNWHVTSLTRQDFLDWQKARLKQAKPGTVNREHNLWRNIFNEARKLMTGFRLPRTWSMKSTDRAASETDTWCRTMLQPKPQ